MKLQLLAATNHDLLLDALTVVVQEDSTWSLVPMRSPQDFLAALQARPWDVVMLDVRMFRGALTPGLLESWRQHAAHTSFVVLTRTGSVPPDMWFEHGAEDVLVLSEDEDQEAHLERWRSRLRVCAIRHRRFVAYLQAARDAAQRESEMLGLNALVHALASSLDRETIVHRTLNILRSLCYRGAAAFLELYESEDSAEFPEGLFSESEVELVPLPGDQAPTPAKSTVARLRVAMQSADDRLLVCMEPPRHSSWTSLIGSHNPKILTKRSGSGLFPGLEPLWYRLKNGAIYLVPVWGRSQPIGVLVLAELETLPDTSVNFSPSSLQAIASQFGGALENAQLFHDIKEAYQSLQMAQDQLVHSEKFAAVGHLAAQLAHEINNPASFVISNLSVMGEYVNTINAFIRHIETSVEERYPSERENLAALLRDHEIDFLQDDLVALLDRSLSGMQRIHQIVQDLRYFSHDAGPEPGWVHLESLIDATINLIRHELKYRARVECEFAGVAEIYTDPNKLSQVLLNLLVNASQALEGGDADTDYIRIGTMSFEDRVLVYVEDSGDGISPEHLHRIFEPFFTTKVRGQGTGLGLSISRDILRRLGGDIRVYSEPGEGTRFELLLPIMPSQFSSRPTPHHGVAQLDVGKS